MSETRDEPMAGSPLCDAEGHAWVWTWPIEGGSGSIGQCSLCGQITTAERDAAARAELSRLRGVVEALADDMEAQAAESTPVMGEVWTVAAREVRRVLAPVSSSGEAGSGEAHAPCCTTCDGTGRTYDSSTGGMCWDCRGTGCAHAPAPVPSGETESGEGREHETFAYGQSGYDGDACRTCRWEGPPGSAAQHRAETRSPAPVSSGGRVEAFVELLPPDVGHNLRHFGPETAHVTGAECHCHPEPIPHAVSSGGQADGPALIAAERRRQVEAEGWTPEHDAEHGPARLLRAAEAYESGDPGSWPWDARWWKPKDALSNLIRAGALYQASADLSATTGAADAGVTRCAEKIDALLATAHRILAARPVLSREALREAMQPHWPSKSTEGVRCLCGWWSRPWREHGVAEDQWLDHLADVLTAGGEQDA